MAAARASSARAATRPAGAPRFRSPVRDALAAAGLGPDERRVLVTHISELIPGAGREAPELLASPDAFGRPNYHRVRDAIRAEIVAGVLKPGSRLKLAELAQRYGLSQAPIREALNQLDAEGLIIMHPNRGAEVRRIDASFLGELYEIRLALEPVLVARSVAHAEARHVAVVTRLQAAFEAAADASDDAEMVRLNAAFHATILGIQPNIEALRVLGNHRAIVNAIRLRFGYKVARVRQIVRDHRALVRCCETRDAVRAESVMRAHIRSSLRFISADVTAVAADAVRPKA